MNLQKISIKYNVNDLLMIGNEDSVPSRFELNIRTKVHYHQYCCPLAKDSGSLLSAIEPIFGMS